MDFIDTDINNYSINELKEIFELDEDFIKEDNLEAAYLKKKQINNKLENIELRNKLNSFFKDVYKFLKENLENRIIKEKENHIENNLNYLVDFNYDRNPKKLETIVPTNQINESNVQINPRTYNIIKKQLSINSEFRKKTFDLLIDESSTDFTIELPEPIDNVIAIELVHIEIPNLLNTFSQRKGNNKFRIDISLNGLTPIPSSLLGLDITIPNGIWTSCNFIEYFSENYFDINIRENGNLINRYFRYLKLDIEENSAKTIFRFKTDIEIENFNLEQESIANSKNITCDPNDILTIAIRNSLSYRLTNIYQEYICKKSERKFNKYRGENKEKINFGFTTLGTMGYELEQIYFKGDLKLPIWIEYSNSKFQESFSLLEKYNGFLKSEKVYGTYQETALYVSVNDFVGNHGQQILLLGYNNSLTSDDILARVPIKIQPFQNLLFNALLDYNIKREYYGGVRIRKLHIQILDKYGRIVDLSDYPTNFVLEFTIEYSS